jgi:hypothetical protein
MSRNKHNSTKKQAEEPKTDNAKKDEADNHLTDINQYLRANAGTNISEWKSFSHK